MATNERTRVKLFPTAKATDVLFYVECTNVLPKNKNPEYDTPYRDCFPHAPEDFPNHKLVFITPADDTGKQKWYFAADREAQDDYNFAFSDADIGGVKFKSVERTYVIRRDSFSPDDPTMGTPMPDTPESMFGTGTGTPKVITDYVLAERAMGATPEKELNSLYVFEKRTYVKRTTIRSLGVDELNGKMLFSDETLWYSGEVVTSEDSSEYTVEQLFAAPAHWYWGLQSNGTQRSGKQLTAAWFLVTTEQVIGGAFTDGLVSVDEVTTNENFYWPPVLNQIDTANIWDKREGGSEIYPAFRFEPEGYSGPTLCKVTRTWSISPQTIVEIPQMLPTSIHYGSPYYTINIPECLHIQVEIFCNIGNSDPVYSPKVDSNRKFTATNHTTWPATIVGEDSQQPFRGGYLRTKKLFYRPTYPTSVGWT